MCRRRSVRVCRVPFTLKSSSKMSVGSVFSFVQSFLSRFQFSFIQRSIFSVCVNEFFFRD